MNIPVTQRFEDHPSSFFAASVYGVDYIADYIATRDMSVLDGSLFTFKYASGGDVLQGPFKSELQLYKSFVFGKIDGVTFEVCSLLPFRRCSHLLLDVLL